MRTWKSDAGAELAEFALVMPLLMMLLIGMYWFGRVFNIAETLTRAANQGAAYAARPECATCSQFDGCAELPGFPCSTQVAELGTFPLLKAAQIDPGQLHPIPQPQLKGCSPGAGLNSTPCPQSQAGGNAACSSYNSGRVWVCRCVEMSKGNQPSECGVTVSMEYPWSFRFPFTGLDRVPIWIGVMGQARQEF